MKLVSTLREALQWCADNQVDVRFGVQSHNNADIVFIYNNIELDDNYIGEGTTLIEAVNTAIMGQSNND